MSDKIAKTDQIADQDSSLETALHMACTLMAKPSVTPREAGALDYMEDVLKGMGFQTWRYPFGEGDARVDNLYARLGEAAPNFCFAGHVDVVPAGDMAAWISEPYQGTLKDGKLIGRGAADMKGAIAAYMAALDVKLKGGWRPKGSLSFLITCDEEGAAINGTRKLLEAITETGEVIDDCLVGEPTNPQTMGEMIKNGRRGSINTVISVQGHQGHVAYPHRAVNPVPALLDILSRLQARHLDEGTEFFQPSNLEITTIDVGNPTENVIPGEATARFNIRFNTLHTGASLTAWIEEIIAQVAKDFDGEITGEIRVSGEAFLTEPGKLTHVVGQATEAVTGRVPALSTSGGTSDARFITHYANVCEFGLVGATMHQVNEHVAVSDIETLVKIYDGVLTRYFS